MAEKTAACYADGKWTQIRDFYKEARPENGDQPDVLKSIGFRAEPWSVIGDTRATAVPLTLTVFSHEETDPKGPAFIVQVEGSGFGNIHHVFAQTLPDLMELLARWTPAVQAAAVADAFVDVNEASYPHGDTDRALTKAVRNLIS